VLADLATFQYDPATVKVDWALSGPVPWRDPAASSSATVHIGGQTDGLVHYSSQLHAGQVPEQPFLVCGQMTTADPTRSPSGTESFWAYTRLPHGLQWSSSDVAAVVAAMERTLETAAPGFSALVLARHVAGPAELEQENANLVGGALSGGTNAIHQQVFLRPIPGLGRADTPVDRLYLASASAHPGGGVHGGPGANAARAALARCRPVTGLGYRGAVQAAQRRLYRM
jgi:phytoene dehydrogenase-like protein